MLKKETIIVSSIILLFIISIFLSLKQPNNDTHASSESISGMSFTGNNKGIAVIEIYGPISFSIASNMLFPTGADLILKQIQLIEEDTNVKGVILKINSPGGTVGASQEIYAALNKCKQKRQIPIYAQIGDVGASGAYYIALAADKIYANPGSLVGSIGVIMGNINIKEFASEQGVSQQTYTGGLYKDVMSMWRDPSAAEKKMLQQLVDNVHDQFRASLIESRGIAQPNLEKVAEGQIFTGEQALQNDLIDDTASFQSVVSKIGEDTGLGENPMLISKTKTAFYDVLSMLSIKIQHLFFNSQTDQLQLYF